MTLLHSNAVYQMGLLKIVYNCFTETYLIGSCGHGSLVRGRYPCLVSHGFVVGSAIIFYCNREREAVGGGVYSGSCGGDNPWPLK